MDTRLTRSNGSGGGDNTVMIPMADVLDKLTQRIADLTKELAVMEVRAEMAERELAERRGLSNP